MEPPLVGNMDDIITAELRILIAEDSKFFAHVLSISLLKHLPNVTIHKVDQLSKIKPWLEQHRIDILILDLMFPEGSSLPKIQEFRQAFPDLIIIVSSGQTKIRVALEAMESGADYYVVKDEGFDSDLLVALKNVSSLITTRRNLQRMIDNVFDEDKYPMVLMKASELGISEVMSDFIEFPEQIDHWPSFIQTVGLGIIVGVGQGDKYHTGVYQIPAAESRFYTLFDFAFQLPDPGAVDPRLRMGYFHLIFFIPNSFQSVFPSPKHLDYAYELLIGQFSSADDLTLDALRRFKTEFFDFLKVYARENQLVT